MGLDMKLELNPAVTVQLAAVRRSAHLKAGEALLAASDVLAPREDGEPRHGEHMIDTGFARLEADAPGGDRVAIGYGAFWAPWQHENPDYEHPHGQWKFLETALLKGSETALEVVADALRAALA